MPTQVNFWNNRLVGVTGGTGFLGYHLVRQLLAAGARVRVLALPPPMTHPINQLTQVDQCYGDITDLSLVQRILADCTVVFHTAGVVAGWGPSLNQLRAVHVAGTRHVLQAASPGARVVHTSSIVAVGASCVGTPCTEESAFNLDGLAMEYVQAKRATESLALAAAQQGQDVVVTNPAYLVGPEDWAPSVMGRFCSRFWRGRVPIAPPGGLNLVDVRDVARGHLLAAQHGQAGRRYILGGENHNFPALMEQLARAAGLRPRLTPRWPFWALWPVALIAELRGWLTGREPYPALAHVRLNRYFWFCNSDRARQELNYQTRPLGETLADTYRWFREHNRFELRGLNHWWMRPAQQAA